MELTKIELCILEVLVRHAIRKAQTLEGTMVLQNFLAKVKEGKPHAEPPRLSPNERDREAGSHYTDDDRHFDDALHDR